MAQEQKTAIKDIASRRIFAPYFKSRWQNMQNIANDSVFFSAIPEPWLSYYTAFIKQWLQWASGFVPMLHRGDFFSLGMGYTVCDIFARECMSGGFRIDSVDKNLKKFIEDWDSGKLSELFNRMFFFANAGGNSILALTPVNGDVFPSVVPINRIIFEIGRHEDITSAVIFNRFVAGSDKIFYAKETRMQLDGKNWYKVELSNLCGTAVSPSWNGQKIKTVPPKISAQWEYAYGNIEPSVWYELPHTFHSLGLYNVKNKSVAVALADMPGYSDSTLHTALDVLYSIDYNYTAQQLDMHWGKTRVIIPKRMQPVNVNFTNRMRVATGVAYEEAVQEAPLADEVFSEAPNDTTVDGTPIKPFFIQPDLRGEAHKYIQDTDLELLAAKVGLSSTTLANHLSFNSDKTATEIRSEQDTTEVSVNNKRSLANRAINAMLNDVAAFYGYTTDVGINWNRAGVNTTGENANMLQEYRDGVLPLKEYLKRRWRDLDEDEINAWVAELAATKQKEQSSIFGGLDGLDGAQGAQNEV